MYRPLVFAVDGVVTGYMVGSCATTLSQQRLGYADCTPTPLSTLTPACRIRSLIQASAIRADCVSVDQPAEIILLCTAAPIRIAMAPAMIIMSADATRISTTVSPR